MTKAYRYILIGGVVLACLIIISCAFSKDRTFRGKVIDYETREPIEGAVVVAHWLQARETISGESTKFKDVKETLTDNNGEWIIVGRKGRADPLIPFWSFITGIHYTRHPEFVIFKPGYESFKPPKIVSLEAYVYVDKKNDLEGIILRIDEKEKMYREKYSKKDPSRAYVGSPFIRMKDPQSRLMGLEIPFDYFEDVKRIFPKASHLFESYTLVGLKKLRTREEKLKALIGPVIGEGALEKQKEFIRLLNEERRNLGLPETHVTKKREK